MDARRPFANRVGAGIVDQNADEGVIPKKRFHFTDVNEISDVGLKNINRRRHAAGQDTREYDNGNSIGSTSSALRTFKTPRRKWKSASRLV